MKHKAISILVPVVVVAVVVGLMAFVVSQDEGGAAALTVDGTSVSQVTINRELAALADTGLAATADGQPAKTVAPGALSSNFTASWLTTSVSRASRSSRSSSATGHDRRRRPPARRDGPARGVRDAPELRARRVPAAVGGVRAARRRARR